MSAPLDGLQPWDGIWRVKRPADYTPGLYRVHQIEARDLLKTADGLSEWEAQFLQTVAYQTNDLKPLQSHWLRRVVREHERAAA